MAKRKTHSPAVSALAQIDASSIIVLACAFATAASAAEWFFIAVLSTAMKKGILLCALCVSSEAGGEKQSLTYPPRIRLSGRFNGTNSY